MKKRIVGMLVVLLGLSVSSVMAQSSEREVLINKIVSLNKTDRVAMIQLAKEYADEVDPIIAEAVIYTLAQQMARPMVEKSYSSLTGEQLREVLRFMRSDAHRRISSDEVAEGLTVYLVPDMMGYLMSKVAGTSWKSEVPVIKDKEYSALVDKYLELTGTLSVFDDMLKPLIAKLKKEAGAGVASMMSSMIKQIQKTYPAYYKAAMIDYVSKEQLQEAVAFYSQPYMIEVQQVAMNQGVSLMSGAMQDPESLAKQMEKFLKENISIEDSLAVVQSYIAQLPYMIVHNKVEPIYPIRTLAMKKKATYTGQTRDGQAYGKGVLTDKKGIRYSGDFKEGKRHGLITTYYLNGDSARYVWADDKIVAQYSDDASKPAPTHKGKAMGYGYTTPMTGKEEGFFIDGLLEGRGKRTELCGNTICKIEEGWFDGGELKKGRTIDQSNAKKIVQFDGEILSDDLSNGVIKVGITKIEERKDGKKIVAVKEGTSINGTMHGMGSWEYGEDGYTSCDEGYFAYDKLYGKGHRTRKWDKNNEVETYEGEFFAGKYQGEGVKTVTWTTDNGTNYKRTVKGQFKQGIPTGRCCFMEEVNNIPLLTDGRAWLFTYYGIQHVIFTDTFSIMITGTFANDKLEGEAEVTLSNGDYYKGVFKNGVFKEGVARKTNSDRSIYEGEMKNGRYEGQGKLTEANGNSDEGIFMYGTCVNGVRKDKRGKVLYKIR